MGAHQHKLSNVRPDRQVADCFTCGPETRVVYKAHKARWACLVTERRRSPEARKRRGRAALLSKYGLTIAEYDSLTLEQGGVCAICQQETAVLAVDHCHATGRVRGLLCTPCNQGLGFFRDSPERLQRAINYLTK